MLRTDPKVLDELRRWADDELRSVNAQLDFVLRTALRKSGRLEPPQRRSVEPDQPSGPIRPFKK